MRKFLGVVAGLATLIATVWIVEAIGHSIWPPPPGINPSDPAQLATLLDQIPLTAKIAVVVAWFAGAVAGAWVANLVARWPVAGWIVVAIGIVLGVMTLVVIPHPLWMQIAAVLAPLIGGWIGLRLPVARS
ncbi:MAG TPA: hypothetical protein VLG14_17345 [Sphingomonas sp.]|nr:hypothetical protein [Sphingomonas sp.]